MTFLAPLMLAGVAAVSIPLALHFFYRARYKPVPWAAMRFLQKSIEQTSRRLKFQEWLLLALRCLVIALIAFALAQPYLTGSGPSSTGGSVDAILLIDNSYSMNIREGTTTRFDRMRSAALKVLDELPAASTVQIISVNDRATFLGPKSPGNLDQARQILGDLQPVDLSSDLLPAFEEALVACERRVLNNKEVYLFSDMQRPAWERQAASLRERAGELRNLASVILVRCGTATPKNVAIIEIRAERGIPHTGVRAPFTVLVRNSGTEAVRDLTVTLDVDGRGFDRDSQSILIVGPGETKAVTLSAKLDLAGPHVLAATLQSDDLDSDNRLERIITVRDRTRILVVDGAPNPQQPDSASSYFLMHALRPVEEARWPNYPIRPRVVSPTEASGALLTDTDVCILANVALKRSDATGGQILPTEFVERLGTYVREGGTLWISSGTRVNPGSYNAALGGELALLPAKLAEVRVYPITAPQHPWPESVEPASFLGAFASSPLDQVSDVEVMKLLTVGENASTDTRILMKTRDQQPLILAKRVGDGEVVLLTTGFDPEWSDWGRRNTFVPFVQTTLAHLVQRTSAGLNRVAGEPIVWPQAESYRQYSMILPTGQRVALAKPQGGLGPDRLTLTFNDTQAAGVYQLVSEDGVQATKFALAPDLRESENLDALSEEQLDELLGFAPVHRVADGAWTLFSSEARGDNVWTVWVLLGLFFLTFGESAWAWVCGRAW